MSSPNIDVDVLIVGLGNPGEKYSKTRHNFGWFVLDELRNKGMDWSPWNWSGKGLVIAGQLFGRQVLMLKPLTMMNASGEALCALASVFNVPNERIIVVHDELDIQFGDVRTKLGGGSGGHRGVSSVQSSLGSSDFHRIRCGIGRPEAGVQVIDHVLGKFSDKELEGVPGTLEEACQRIQEIMFKVFDGK